VRLFPVQTAVWVLHMQFDVKQETALRIYNVMEVLDNMNKHPLKSLYLPYNGWESIPNDMFNSFEDSNIRLINLRGNESIPFYYFNTISSRF
jgi:hypothetical protein